jgi:hypothetical protein
VTRRDVDDHWRLVPPGCFFAVSLPGRARFRATRRGLAPADPALAQGHLHFTTLVSVVDGTH